MRLKNKWMMIFTLIITVVLINSCREDLLQIPASNNWKVEVQTDSVLDIKGNSASVTGMVNSINNDKIVTKGFCWDTLPNPGIKKSIIVTDDNKEILQCTIEDLSPDKKYYVKAYVTTNYATFYGNEINFFTLDGLPRLDSLNISDITQTSVTGLVKLIDDCGFPVSSMGICLSQHDSPTITDTMILAVTIKPESSILIENLNYNTQYYLRAFATNNMGTAYGETTSLKTSPGIPMVETEEVYANGLTYAYFMAVLINDGGLPINKMGFCYSKNNQPSLEDSIILAGSHNDTPVLINNLERDTKYYYRCFASNQSGTGFGEVKSFTTLNGLSVVETWDVSDIKSNSAVCNGHIDNDTGGESISYGFCYSKDSLTSIVSDTVSIPGDYAYFSKPYSKVITNLEANTRYFYRAYATTNYGTTYGEEKSFYTTAK